MKILKTKKRIKKKLTIFLLFIFLSFFSFIYNVTGKEVDYVSSNVDIKEVNPVFPKSGDLLTITFELANIGNERGNFYIYFLNNTVFQFISTNKNVINVGPKETKEFKAYFKINPNTISGNYPLIMKVISETGEEKKYTFFIKIKNEPNLVMKQKNIICLIGKECPLDIELLNNGYGLAKNIIINFNLPSKTIEIKKISSQSSQPLNTTIFIPEDLNEGVYNLKAIIYFTDENNNIIKKEINIPLELKSDVNLDISSLQYDKENRYIKIKIENPGEGKAKNIKMDVELPNLNLEQTFYIGTLDEGEDSTVYFYLPDSQYLLQNKIDKNHPIKIRLQWVDNKEKQKNFESKLIIYDKNKEKIKITNILIIAAIIILAIVIYMVAQKRKKQKEDN